MKNRKQLFMTSRLLLIIVAVALVLSMGLTACGLPSGTPNGKTPDVADSGNAGEDQPAQSLTTTSRVNLDETYGELLPLYETLTEQEGSAYSLAFNLTGVVNTADISGAIDLRYVVTIDENEQVSMMFLDENDNVLFSYKDGKINLDGFGMDIGYYQYRLDHDQLPPFPPDAAGSIMDILAALNGFLSDYDTLAQVVPAVFNSMNFDTTGLVMTSQDGEYVFNANCQPLLILASTYLSDSFDDLLAELPFEIDIAQLLGVENTEASDLELLIAAVDDMFFDGALMSGYIDLNAHLTITEKGFDVSVALLNAADHDESYFYLEIGARIEDEIPIEVPEVTTLHDIQADIPISLPQSGIDMTIHAIFHTADIFAEENKDFITATVDLNGLEDVASIVVNDGYLYVDINKLVMIANQLVEEPTDYTYILPFKEGHEIHTILRNISRVLNGIMEMTGFFDLFDEEGYFRTNLIVMGDIYEGMTEEEVREILYVEYIYRDKMPKEVFNYEILGGGRCPEHGAWITVSYDNEFDRWGEYPPSERTFEPNAPLHWLNITWPIDDMNYSMSEAALRDVLHVYDGDVEVLDYVINDFSGCSYCGCFSIDISYDGCRLKEYGRARNYDMYYHFSNGTGSNYIGNTDSHQLLVSQCINPHGFIDAFIECDPTDFYEGMTLEEVHDVVRYIGIYRGSVPAPISFEVTEFEVNDNKFELEVRHWINYNYSAYYSSKEGFIYDDSVNSLLKVLRLDVDPRQEKLNFFAEAIGGIFGICFENQDILGNAIQVEDIENGKNISVCLSGSTLGEEGDLFSLLNQFIGLPGENGLFDIDGPGLYDFLEETLDVNAFNQLENALQMAGGFELEDLCNDLYLNVTGYLNNNNKLRFGFSLSGADNDPEVDETYLSIGIIEYHAVVTDSAYDANLTAEDLAAANPLDEIVDVLFGCLASLMSMGGDLE